MKKTTIQEEKARFFEISRRLTNESLTGMSMLPGGSTHEVKKHMEAIRELCPDDDEFKRMVTTAMEEMLSNPLPNDSEKIGDEAPVSQETDEYAKTYDKNMSQGFSPINEGNAFVGATKKAREEGKDSFELGGKTYKVTVKASKK